jgi:hypothetical protein
MRAERSNPHTNAGFRRYRSSQNDEWFDLPPPEKLFDIVKFQLDIGWTAMVALT